MYVEQYTTLALDYKIRNEGDNAYLTTLVIEYPSQANYIRLEDEVCTYYMMNDVVKIFLMLHLLKIYLKYHLTCLLDL